MRQATFVIAKDGTKLMPTFNPKKVRKLLRSHRAKIVKYSPFTIQLCYESEHGVQEIDIDVDTGYQTIGISVKSAKHEYVSEERTLLRDEKEAHDACRKYRRTRRNRLRYRAPRFNNRKKGKGWLAPSIRNKKDQHLKLIQRYADVCPISRITLEMATFDTQLLQAIEENKPLPKGKDYQQGPRYRFDTLRAAVFYRDNYQCICCKRSGLSTDPDKRVKLRVHHIGFRSHDHSDRMGNLATVCSDCHTPANHQKGGKLWNLKPKAKPKKAAAFMNTVRSFLLEDVKKALPNIAVYETFGTLTKWARKTHSIKKSHANDAFCIGRFFPLHRVPTQYWQKTRRHNRVLSRFFDAKYIDIRDGSIKTGSQLSSGRVNRNFKHKDTKENLRKYRGEQVKKGYYAIRYIRYPLQPGDRVSFENQKYVVVGTNKYGKSVVIINAQKKVNPSIKKVRLLSHANGWKPIFMQKEEGSEARFPRKQANGLLRAKFYVPRELNSGDCKRT